MACMRAVAALSLAVLTLGACMPPADGSVIDGWELGERVDCAIPNSCADEFAVAAIGLDQTSQGHLPIVAFDLFKIPMPIVHGPTGVVVLQLTDGSRRAFGVGHVGVGGLTPWLKPEEALWPGGSSQDCPRLPETCPEREPGEATPPPCLSGATGQSSSVPVSEGGTSGQASFTPIC